MRLMSYIRKHPTTGIFWYRRSVPLPLRPHLPVVAGFGDKLSRTEFTKTLATREEAKANRLAAELDGRVQIALDEAKRRLDEPKGGKTAVLPESAPRPSPTVPHLPPIVRPADLFDASDRWKTAEIERLEIAVLNGRDACVAGEESLGVHGKYNIQQAANNPRNETWKKVENFDQMLVGALSSVGLDLSTDHPALPKVRADFAGALYYVLEARDNMRLGLWEYGGGQLGRRSLSPTAPHQPLGRTNSPSFLFKVEDWRASLTMKQRQAAVCETDVRQFAAHLGTVQLDQVQRINGQQWVEALARNWTTKTINRKLSALRNYWNYLQAHQLVRDDQQPFSRLRVPRIPGTDTREFSKQEVVDIWNWVRSEKWAKSPNYIVLANAIQIAAFTGARLESIFQMNFEDQAIVDDVLCFQFDDKTEAGKRAVPIHPAISALVKRLAENPQPGGFLLPSTASNKHDERGSPTGKRFGSIKTKLGFNEAYRFHSIRKTVATLLERAECPEGVAADILGHDKPTQTFGLYSGGAQAGQKLSWLEKALVYPSADFMGAC